MAADVGLRLVAQARAEGEVLMHAPVVLNEAAKVHLANARLRVAAIDRELCCPAAERAYLCGRQASALQEKCATVAFDAGDGHENNLAVGITDKLIVRIKLRCEAAAEDERAAEVRGRDIVEMHAAQAHAEFERVLSQRERGVVLQLPAIFIGEGEANLRSSADERFLDVDGRDGIIAALIGATMDVLKARLVDHLLVEHCGLC